MGMKVRAVVFAVAAVVTLGLVQPTAAIRYGELDNGAHPYVGGLVYEIEGN